jgi:hypothetical protein
VTEDIKAKLLGPRIVGEGDERPHIDIEGIGRLYLRPLNRAAALRLRTVDDLAEKDNLLIHLGVAEPALSLDEVRAWAEVATAGELSAVSEAIATISGMTKGSAKEATKSAPRRRR